ncbi:phosphate ABC transporter substrate-binding protein, PhoT family [Thalassoporum mexicanum PCC 7367]|uniref:phosphate ABC transporter substrate-binding protein PstS n=1 Tax=Thalassoporum mexicanum TaxID=3457544 RepID=UPI00029FC426|nr:phosphate ABC transporter substrate-binding protein PstS [Pseudanabaena sp. PCC 7367]AFY70527.1 phosphate ABC transporter substrate-binding protein, PhoT family [Pseudanabaena sp. PCC 7367]
MINSSQTFRLADASSRLCKLGLAGLVMAIAAACGSGSNPAPTATSPTSLESEPSSNLKLNGAGATFPRPLYARYFNAYAKQTGIEINYSATGSGSGIKQFSDGIVDFAGSDIPLGEQERSNLDRGLILVPTAGGAVAIIYNLPGVEKLNLSRELLPAIFMGEIKTWNDPLIAAVNPDVSLPNLPITVVVRADASGTTFIFTSHLAAISAGFADLIGINQAPNWPTNFYRAPKSDGVAAIVQQTRGTISYVQSSYATQGELNTAAIENKAGKFVLPTLAEANRAFETIAFNSDFTTANSEDPDTGYPIVGATWLLLYKKYDHPQKATAVKEAVTWILTEGQEMNGELEYTRIPTQVAQQIIEAIAVIN